MPARVRQILGWLPSNTETVMAATTPFVMPRYVDRQVERDDHPSPLQTFQGVGFSLFGIQAGQLQIFLEGNRVQIIIEGSRHFRPPAELGEVLYEGCQIAVLEKADPQRSDLFAKAIGNGLKSELVAGFSVTLLPEKLEGDLWTAYVAFPKPDMAIACSHRAYLTEVLERIHGKAGRRALPDTLAEWKFIDPSAPV
jgi:hypothetical protein